MLNALVAQLVLAYRQTYPAVRLSLKEGPNTALIEDLLEKRIDVAILRQVPRISEQCKMEALSHEDTLLALPEQHPLVKHDAIELSLLASEPLILFPRHLAPDLYDEIISACERAGFAPLLGQEAPHLASTVTLVAAGLGIAIVPRSIEQIHLAGVVYREIHPKPPSTQIMLAYRGAEHSQVVLGFMKVVRNKKMTF
jgi:DNA-binding transcriptional LysR family regulator